MTPGQTRTFDLLEATYPQAAAAYRALLALIESGDLSDRDRIDALSDQIDHAHLRNALRDVAGYQTSYIGDTMIVTAPDGSSYPFSKKDLEQDR